MNAFESMVGQLHMSPTQSSRIASHKVSMDEYNTFYKEFVFNKLKGETLGIAFCKRFDFDDFVLQQVSDDTAKTLIESLGYIKQ